MPHSQKLTELKEFKWALWGPLGAAVIVAMFITVADYLSPESLQFCITSECINDAIKRHKLSLGIAALVFPLVALVASNHRSIQTVAQIKATEQKNNFENHIKHKEMFKSKIENLTKTNDFIKLDSEKLYKFITNNANSFKPYVDINDNTVLTKLEKCFSDIVNSQEEITHISYLYYLNAFFEINKLLSDIFDDDLFDFFNVMTDLEISKNYFYFVIELYKEAASYAYDNVSIFEFNKGDKNFLNDIDNFETLAFEEDQDDEDDWGEKTYEFGNEFRSYLTSEYKFHGIKLVHIDEYLNTPENLKLF